MSHDPPLMVYVIGPTNAGKTTLLNLCVLDPRIVTVEVGKMMRAKYPPSHFQGQNNPKHTADEAWQMYLDGVQRGIDNPECKLTVCDGQPRDVKQTEDVIADKRFHKLFVHLWAPDEVRERRAEARDFDSPEALALSKARLVNDIPSNYGVLVRLLNAKETVWSYDTSAASYSARLLLDTLLAHAYYHRRAK
jgi:hypothetical protein